MTPSSSTHSRTALSRRRMLFVVSGVWLRLKKIRCSESSSAMRHKALAEHLSKKGGAETVRVDFVADGQAEGEAQRRLCLLGGAVALRCCPEP